VKPNKRKEQNKQRLTKPQPLS